MPSYFMVIIKESMFCFNSLKCNDLQERIKKGKILKNDVGMTRAFGGALAKESFSPTDAVLGPP